MTMVLNEGTDGCRTHAFVIGVGDYQHLPGGTDPDPNLDNWGLEQLTSPPYSAKGMADWIVETLHNPRAPLGTVEMLLSPPQPYRSERGKVDTEVEAATMNKFREASKSL